MGLRVPHSCGREGWGNLVANCRVINRRTEPRPAARRQLGLEEACQRLWAAGRVLRYLRLAKQTMSAHIPLKTVGMVASPAVGFIALLYVRLLGSE